MSSKVSTKASKSPSDAAINQSLFFQILNKSGKFGLGYINKRWLASDDVTINTDHENCEIQCKNRIKWNDAYTQNQGPLLMISIYFNRNMGK